MTPIRTFQIRAILLALLLFTNAALFATDISGDWEFAWKYLGEVSYLPDHLQDRGR
jgi:hypothetical protein